MNVGSTKSLIDTVADYYAARAAVYDETAGYHDEAAKELRAPIKEWYRSMFVGKNVLEIACGSGYWTAVIAESASSIFAVDINEELILQAERRCRQLPNVRFQIADAYALGDVPTQFNAAFAVWWWSHIPKERLPVFLSTLHDRLDPGALVLFIDQLPYDGFERRIDSNGNILERRSLPDGRTFEIVKNFPSEKDIRDTLEIHAENVQYRVRPDEKSWSVTYNVC